MNIINLIGINVQIVDAESMVVLKVLKSSNNIDQAVVMSTFDFTGKYTIEDGIKIYDESIINYKITVPDEVEDTKYLVVPPTFLFLPNRKDLLTVSTEFKQDVVLIDGKFEKVLSIDHLIGR